MFMFRTTHDRLMAATKEQISNQSFSLRDGAKKNQALTDSLAVAKTRQATLDAEIISLKARIAEMEKPVAITKAVPAAKAKPVNKAVAVPVKGKVEAKSGKVTK